MRDTEKHNGFMSLSDCNVYVNEVESENFSFGRVEQIDTTKASGCALQQLRTVYLLYYDTICVSVFNIHPKNNIKDIEYFIRQFQTDTTRLSNFVKLDSSIRLRVDRLCKDRNDENYFGEYTWWKDIEYSTSTIPYKKTSDDILTTWYKWKE